MDTLKLGLWILALSPLALSDFRYKKTLLKTWLYLILLVNIHLIINANSSVFCLYIVLFNASQFLLCLADNKLYLGLGLADYRLLLCAIFYFNWHLTAIYLLISCLFICIKHLYGKYTHRKDAHSATKRASTYPLIFYFGLANILDLAYKLSLLII